MPAKQGYDWSDISSPPILEEHSVIKHKILADYIERYINVVTINPRVNPLRLNLIDGFAGGGRYKSRHDSSIVDGSPLVLIKAIEQAEAAIDAIRNKPFRIDANYYFSGECKHFCVTAGLLHIVGEPIFELDHKSI